MNSAVSDTDRAAMPGSQTRSRLTLILLFALFFAPVAISLLLQTPMFHYNAPATKNFGTMISPVVPVPDGEARQAGLQTNAAAPWTIMLVPGVDAIDPAALKLLETIREAQGRHIDRVRLEVIETAPINAGAAWRVKTFAPDALALLRTQLGLPETGGVVILDPFRNAMLRHVGSFDGSKLRKDLARILRISQAGKPQSEGLIG
jgi:hypothetical protein